MNYSYKPFQVISDGKNMYYADDASTYKLVNPGLKSINISREMICQETLGEMIPEMIPGFIDIDLQIVATDMIPVGTADEILIDFFHNSSIRDLLKEINKKINVRTI